MKESPTADESKLRSLISEITQRDASAPALDDDLFNKLGIDSLAGLRALASIEKRFDVRFPDERLAEFRTMGSILDFIRESRKGGGE